MSAELEILLVEDNPHDAELAQRNRNLASHIVRLKDGREALDWLLIDREPVKRTP
jgi:hypothetical protein